MPSLLSKLLGVEFGGADGAPASSLVRRTELRRTTTTRAAALALASLVWQSASFGDEAQAPADNPFRAAAGAPALPDGTLAVPTTHVPAAAPGGAAAKAQSDQLLLDARRALSVGDLPRAQQFLSKAMELKATYDGPGDSPQAVQDSITEYQETAPLRSVNGGANWRVAYAKFLVKQADALLSWNDLDTAARAANEAAQLNPQFSGTGITPQDVLRRIEQRRKGANTLAVAAPPTTGDAKNQTLALLADARKLLAEGKVAEAQTLAGKASALNVPDSQFGPNEDRPSQLALDLQRAASATPGMLHADASLPTTSTPGEGNLVQAAAATETGAAMQLAQVPELTPAPMPLPSADASPLPGSAAQMLEAGEQALRAGDRESALQSFKAAHQNREQLDVLSQQRLQGHLQMLSASAPRESTPAAGGELLDAAAEGQSVLARQLSADVYKRQSEAEKLRSTDPKRALKLLEEARAQIEDSQLSQELKSQLLRRVEMTVSATNKYIQDHKSELDLEATNREILSEIDRDRKVKLEVQQKMAQMVDEFNKLVDEHRYAEAEVVANRLYEMAPDELVAQQVNKQAKMIRRERWNQDIIAKSEQGVAETFLGIRQASADALAQADTPFSFPTDWESIKNRKSLDLGGSRSIKELEIEQKLKTPVLPKYNDTPLTKVVEGLSQLAGVNIHLDPRGLSQEGVRSDQPVTLNLPQEVSLKSALTLILEPLHLTYTIKDEVLKITSEQIRDGDLIQKVYPVGDLVIPIPNFVPSNNIGLQGLINDAYAAMGAYGPGGVGGPVAIVRGSRASSAPTDMSTPTSRLPEAGGRPPPRPEGRAGSAAPPAPTSTRSST
jgi:general secretion pathway protein D